MTTQQIPGVDAEKVRVNYNGIDLVTFSSSGTARKPHSIVTVGRLIEKKGFILNFSGAVNDNGVLVRFIKTGFYILASV